MWHMTHVKWHMKCDMWHVVRTFWIKVCQQKMPFSGDSFSILKLGDQSLNFFLIIFFYSCSAVYVSIFTAFTNFSRICKVFE